jgi:tryptophanyl-tRNA synthetase
MAADVLLYDAKYVPVGIDQTQHLELARDIANRFNNKYGETFVIPEPKLAKVGTKIMSLSDPTKKMSKSDENEKGCIYLLDDISVIRKKIMSSVTDSEAIVKYDVENKPGISNLLTIYSSLKGISIDDAVNEFANNNYGEFKKAVANQVVSTIQEIQNRYHEIISSGKIDQIFMDGANKARSLASKKLAKVLKKIGLGI